jgi:hypothetical protein
MHAPSTCQPHKLHYQKSIRRHATWETLSSIAFPEYFVFKRRVIHVWFIFLSSLLLSYKIGGNFMTFYVLIFKYVETYMFTFMLKTDKHVQNVFFLIIWHFFFVCFIPRGQRKSRTTPVLPRWVLMDYSRVNFTFTFLYSMKSDVFKYLQVICYLQ